MKKVFKKSRKKMKLLLIFFFSYLNLYMENKNSRNFLILLFQIFKIYFKG